MHYLVGCCQLSVCLSTTPRSREPRPGSCCSTYLDQSRTRSRSRHSSPPPRCPATSSRQTCSICLTMLNNTTSASKIELIRHASEIQHRMAVFFVVAKFKIKTLAGIYSKYCRIKHRPISLTCLAASLPALDSSRAKFPVLPGPDSEGSDLLWCCCC